MTPGEPPAPMDETGFETHLPGFRRALRLLGIGLPLIYAVTVPLKAAGMMPPHVTWRATILGPVALLGLYAAPVAGVAVFGRRCWWFIVPALAACGVIAYFAAGALPP